MIKLLMRFYDVNRRGQSRSMDTTSKTSTGSELQTDAFGMVLAGYLAVQRKLSIDNIKYGKLDATHEEVVAAAKAAHVHRFVQTLPSGYHMESSTKKLATYLRARNSSSRSPRAILAADPKILILDEATSSVDTRTEVQIQKAIG